MRTHDECDNLGVEDMVIIQVKVAHLHMTHTVAQSHPESIGSKSNSRDRLCLVRQIYTNGFNQWLALSPRASGQPSMELHTRTDTLRPKHGPTNYKGESAQ